MYHSTKPLRSPRHGDAAPSRRNDALASSSTESHETLEQVSRPRIDFVLGKNGTSQVSIKFEIESNSSDGAPGAGESGHPLVAIASPHSLNVVVGPKRAKRVLKSVSVSQKSLNFDFATDLSKQQKKQIARYSAARNSVQVPKTDITPSKPAVHSKP